MKKNLFRSAAGVVLLLGMLLTLGTAAGKDGMDDPGTEISGVVQAMPASGLVGDWMIAGKEVTTDAATRFEQEDGTIGVGALVEVVGALQADGSLKAAKMEVKIGTGPPLGGGEGTTASSRGRSYRFRMGRSSATGMSAARR